jgi:septal ring factor EnvC (AmiA/AmiB activator)
LARTFRWCALGFGLAIPAASIAQTAEQLKAVEQDLKNSEAEKKRLAAEGQKVVRDLESARQQTVTLAKDIQDQEYSLLVLENRIADLEADAAKQSAALGRRDAQMRKTLMALERLALRPADALTLSPLTPDDAVRAAILLRAAVPAIATSANSLQGELGALYKLRSEIVAQREKVAAGAAALVAKRSRLEATITTRTAQQTTIAARGQEVEAKVGRLSQQAEDLRALFAKLAEEKAKRDAEARKVAEAAKAAQIAAAAAAKAAAKEAKADAKAKTEEKVVLKAPPGVSIGDSGPQRLFSKAKGTLPFPVIGKVTARYGEIPPGAAEGTLLSKGLTIAARSGSTVVSPFDGVVAFAGPFRGYGELLIIEHSEGYHTLLAGLGRIDGTVGQRVLAGEPVGAMSSEKSAALYVELRRDGQPINPLPWLAERRGSDQVGQNTSGPG